MFLITVIPFHANADLLNSAVRIKAQIPEKARTSKFLGKEREGSGIVIDDETLEKHINEWLELQHMLLVGIRYRHCDDTLKVSK